MANEDNKNDKHRVDKRQAISNLVYQPIFELSENRCPGLGDKKMGEQVQLVVNYRIVEKTKNYCILKVSSVCLRPSMRTF